MKTGWIGWLSVAVSIACGVAQVTGLASALPQQEPRFEVGSVRLWDKTTWVSQRVTDTRLEFTNVTLQSALLLAFRVPEIRFIGPDWLEQVRIDIRATIPDGVSRKLVPEMLRQLLSERFGIVAHRESRLMDGFELVRGKNAITMREVAPLDEFAKPLPRDPKATSAAAQALADRIVETPDGPVRRVMRDLGATTITDRTMYSLRLASTTNVEKQILEATRMTMAELAAVLTTNVGQPVIDRTGLAGVYQFRVELPLDAKFLNFERSMGVPRSDPPGVSASRAAEALGLKLESRRLPFEVVVVDQIQRVPREQ